VTPTPSTPAPSPSAAESIAANPSG
jgi:hypothetical protein